MYQAASKLGKMWKPQRSKVVSFITHPPKKEEKKSPAAGIRNTHYIIPATESHLIRIFWLLLQVI